MNIVPEIRNSFEIIIAILFYTVRTLFQFNKNGLFKYYNISIAKYASRITRIASRFGNARFSRV